VRPLPPGYLKHQATLLAGRRLYLAIWHIANGLPADAHLNVLRALIRSSVVPRPHTGRKFAELAAMKRSSRLQKSRTLGPRRVTMRSPGGARAEPSVSDGT